MLIFNQKDSCYYLLTKGESDIRYDAAAGRMQWLTNPSQYGDDVEAAAHAIVSVGVDLANDVHNRDLYLTTTTPEDLLAAAVFYLDTQVTHGYRINPRDGTVTELPIPPIKVLTNPVSHYFEMAKGLHVTYFNGIWFFMVNRTQDRCYHYPPTAVLSNETISHLRVEGKSYYSDDKLGGVRYNMSDNKRLNPHPLALETGGTFGPDDYCIHDGEKMQHFLVRSEYIAAVKEILGM